MSAAELGKAVKNSMNITVSYTDGQRKIEKIFFIAGCGKDMTQEITKYNCNCIITGESSYHDMFDLKYLGISTICIGHDVSEKVSVEPLAQLLAKQFKDIAVIPYTQQNLTEYL